MKGTPGIAKYGTVGDTKTRNAGSVEYFVSQKLMKLWPSADLGKLNFRLAQCRAISFREMGRGVTTVSI